MLAPFIAVPLAAALSAGLIVRLRPLLVRYALARPNARSSHTEPTPQGGGIAVVAATLAVTGLLIAAPEASRDLLVLGLGTVVLAIVGAVDDIRPLPASLRLVLQAVVVGALVASIPGQVVPALPPAIERALAVLAGVWFVNLVNFMDGLDWMTVAETVPVAASLALFGGLGTLPPAAILVSAALLGAMLGFAPFNRPVAKLFLGDVGALPLGLILAWLLYRLALEGGLAAAILLPLYYVADATLTLIRRAARREPVWQAHRSHFYQRATTNGIAVGGVVGRVFALNLGLAALAAATLLWPSPVVTFSALAAGCALVAVLLRRFSQAPAEDGARMP